MVLSTSLLMIGTGASCLDGAEGDDQQGHGEHGDEAADGHEDEQHDEHRGQGPGEGTKPSWASVSLAVLDDDRVVLGDLGAGVVDIADGGAVLQRQRTAEGEGLLDRARSSRVTVTSGVGAEEVLDVAFDEGRGRRSRHTRSA